MNVLMACPGTQTVTLTKAQMLRTSQVDALINCWEYHVGRSWGKTTDDVSDNPSREDDDTSVLPVTFFGTKKGPGPVKMNRKKFDGYSYPPSPNDRVWILNEFLNPTLDDKEGERLFVWRIDRFPKYSNIEIKTHLEQFILAPKYRNYPHKETWLAIVREKTVSTSSQIRANVVFCREMLSEKEKTKTMGIHQIPGARWPNESFGLSGS